MASLIGLAEIRKASNEDIIDTLSKLADVLNLRETSMENYDQDSILEEALSRNEFSSDLERSVEEGGVAAGYP